MLTGFLIYALFAAFPIASSGTVYNPIAMKLYLAKEITADYTIFRCDYKKADFLKHPDLYAFPEGYKAEQEDERVMVFAEPRYNMVMVRGPKRLVDRYRNASYLKSYSEVPLGIQKQSNIIIFLNEFIIYGDGAVYIGGFDGYVRSGDTSIYQLPKQDAQALTNIITTKFGSMRGRAESNLNALMQSKRILTPAYIKVGADVVFVPFFEENLPPLKLHYQQILQAAKKLHQTVASHIDHVQSLYNDSRFAELLQVVDGADTAIFRNPPLSINHWSIPKMYVVAHFKVYPHDISRLKERGKRLPGFACILHYAAALKETDLQMRIRLLNEIMEEHRDYEGYSQALILLCELLEETGEFRRIESLLDVRVADYFFQNVSGFREEICREWADFAKRHIRTKEIKAYYPGDLIGRSHPFTPRNASQDLHTTRDVEGYTARRIEILVPKIPDGLKTRHEMHRWLRSLPVQDWYPDRWTDMKTGFQRDVPVPLIVPDDIEPGLHFVANCLIHDDGLTGDLGSPDYSGVDIHGEPGDPNVMYTSQIEEQMGEISIIDLKLRPDTQQHPVSRTKLLSSLKPVNRFPCVTTGMDLTKDSKSCLFSSPGAELIRLDLESGDTEIVLTYHDLSNRSIAGFALDNEDTAVLLCVGRFDVLKYYPQDKSVVTLLRGSRRDQRDEFVGFVPGKGIFVEQLGRPRSMVVRSIRTGDTLYECPLDKNGDVHGLFISPNNEFAGTVDMSYPGTTRIWRIDGWIELAKLNIDPKSGQESLRQLSFTRDGRNVVSGSQQPPYDVLIWNTQSWKVDRRLSGHLNSVMAVSLTPDDRHIISGGRDGVIRIWDIGTGRQICALGENFHGVRELGVTPNGKYLIARTELGYHYGMGTHIFVWDISNAFKKK